MKRVRRLPAANMEYQSIMRTDLVFFLSFSAVARKYMFNTLLGFLKKHMMLIVASV